MRIVRSIAASVARVGYDGLGFTCVSLGVGAYDYRLGLIAAGALLIAYATLGALLQLHRRR